MGEFYETLQTESKRHGYASWFFACSCFILIAVTSFSVYYVVDNPNFLQESSSNSELNVNSKRTILLSPAAASYDQFNNFEDRGGYFKNLIIKKFKRRLNA